MTNGNGGQNAIEQADELLKKITEDGQNFCGKADGLINEIKQGIGEFNQTDKELEAADKEANENIETAVLEFLSSQSAGDQKKED
ncbi:MAG: hypothetical protein AAB358_02735 [Patescibacteria group bacterium]